MGLFSGISYWISQRNLWQTRANTAYDTGVWGSGNTWQTDYNNEVAAYNAEVTAYNNLLNGLNSPDGLTSVAISATLSTNGTSGTTTLTLPRTGHYMWAVDARVAVTLSSQGSSVGFTVSGIATDSRTTTFQNNTGSPSVYYGLAGHGDYTAGQTLTITFTTGDPLASAVASGTLYAHFVPNAANHN